MNNCRTCSNGMLLKNLRRTVKKSSLPASVFSWDYYSSSLATVVLLWSTDDRVNVDTREARPPTVCALPPGTAINFFVDGHK